MFEKLDTSGDGELTLDEFKKSLSTIRTWGFNIQDSEAIKVFKEINRDESDNVIT